MEDFRKEIAQTDSRTLNIAVSPSGNFYGSEQTLMTYMEHTRLRFLLFIPANSCKALTKRAKTLPNVSLRSFQSPLHLYVWIVWFILQSAIRKICVNVYLNEAGFIRYLNRLPRLGLVQKVVHVRLTEDAKMRPWQEVNREDDGLVNIVIYCE